MKHTTVLSIILVPWFASLADGPAVYHAPVEATLVHFKTPTKPPAVMLRAAHTSLDNTVHFSAMENSGDGHRRTADAKRESSICFTENRGQIVDSEGRLRSDILFTAEAQGATVFFRNDAISYVFHETETSKTQKKIDGPAKEESDMSSASQSYRMDMSLVGRLQHARIRGEEQLPGQVNYYLPHWPTGVTGVRQYRKIIYENVYRNIDLEMFTVDGRMKYNFVVRPGGDAKDILMKYEGATTTALAVDGDLVVATPIGRIEEARPYTYAGDARNEVSSRFFCKGNTVSFEVGEYDRSKTLVIDPWATYYGGTNWDVANAVATDANGNVYVAGATGSIDFPVANALQPTSSGTPDAFVIKFDNAGNRIWATYYGGSGDDRVEAIAVDGNGNVLVCGNTGSTNFPVQNAFQGANAGRADAFILKLSATGTRQWATYYGGAPSGNLNNTSNVSGSESARGICADGSGNVFITGWTTSDNFPLLNAFQKKLAGSGNTSTRKDAFLLKFSPAGVRQWATYYGGSSADMAWDLANDGSGNVVLCGQTSSTNFPVLGAWQGGNAGGGDAFVAKFSGGGARLWATYYGGAGADIGNGVAVDGNGNVVFCGSTSSTNFPVFNAFQNSLSGNTGSSDAFIVKMNSSGSRLWATYYGGSVTAINTGGADIAASIVTDASGNVILCGSTNSVDFPVLNALQTTKASPDDWYDAFIAKFTGGGAQLWSTYYGGTDGFSAARGVATDATGNVVVAGSTISTSFPTYNAFQPSIAGLGGINGNDDAFIVHLNSNGLFLKPAGRFLSAPRLALLEQNYPNPVSVANVPSTVIRYSLTEESAVVLRVHDILGAEVATLVDGVRSAGTHEAVFSMHGLIPGAYTYTLEAGNERISKMMLLEK